MTDRDVARERREMIRILHDPQHAHYAVLVDLLLVYSQADRETQGFIRAIAPYVFAETGEPLETVAHESDAQR